MIVLYASAATVAALSGEPRLQRAGASGCATPPRCGGTTVEAVRASLAAVPGFAGFRDLPEVRAPGEWPGQGGHRAVCRVPQRDHAAGAALGARPDLQHDDDARRRADGRDRDHARARRPPAAGRARLRPDGPAARRARRSRRVSRSASCSRTSLQATSARCSGRSTSASASTRTSWWSARSSSACSAPPLAALPAIRRGVPHRPARGARVHAARRSAARTPATGLLRRVALPAADDADRPARRRAAQAPQPRDGVHRRARRRQPAGGARRCRRRRPRRPRTSWGDHLEDVRICDRRQRCSTRAPSGDPHDARRRRGTSRRSSTTSSSTARTPSSGACVRRPLFRYRSPPGAGSRRTRSSTRARRGDRAQHRRRRRHRRRRPRRCRRRPAPPRFRVVGIATTSRRTAPRCSSR